MFYNALRLKVSSNSSMNQTSTSRILNLISNDVNRFDLTILFLPFLWIGPIETAVVTYFLWEKVSVSSLFGVATLVMFIP